MGVLSGDSDGERSNECRACGDCVGAEPCRAGGMRRRDRQVQGQASQDGFRHREVDLQGSPGCGCDGGLRPYRGKRSGRIVTNGQFRDVAPQGIPARSRNGAGVYKVVATKFEQAAAPATPSGGHDDPMLLAKPKNLLPKKYADASTSDVSITITDKGTDSLAIELKE